MVENISSDLAKEFLTFLSFMDEDTIKNIPSNFLKMFSDLAANSTKEFYIDKNKNLNEQNMSEECKDLLSLLYFINSNDSNEQNEILNAWNLNDDINDNQ